MEWKNRRLSLALFVLSLLLWCLALCLLLGR